MPYAAVRGERSLSVNGRPVDTWTGLREVGADLGDLDAGLLVQAIGILEWHERNRFSPLTGCGDHHRAGRLGAARPHHRHRVFPRTDPAVIMLVHDGGTACVLGRQAVWPPGPVLRPRRVRRAGGVRRGGGRPRGRRGGRDRVTDVRYVASQPWPFPQSLMLGFTARADGDPTLRLDHDEIEEARWFTRDELRSGEGPRALPPPVSIARHIIDRWLAGEFS